MHIPFAALVELSDHARPDVFAPVIQLLLELVFDHLALFFHHQDFIKAARELSYSFRLQRPGHADLEKPYAYIRGQLLRDPKLAKRVKNIHIALA